MKKNSTSLVAVLHDIRSAHNVGSIFRTCDAAGFSEIYLCGITPTPLDRFGRPFSKLTKVSLGAENSLVWQYRKSTRQCLAVLKKQGYGIYAGEKHTDSIPYTTFHTRHQKIALVVGNEIQGLPEDILKQADAILEIPMKGKKESLNVSVAFGILAFRLLEDL